MLIIGNKPDRYNNSILIINNIFKEAFAVLLTERFVNTVIFVFEIQYFRNVLS